MYKSLKQARHNSMLQTWSERVRECRGSGLSVREWCEQNGYKVSVYYRWQREVFNAVSQQVQPTATDSMPVFAEISPEFVAQSTSSEVAATMKFGDVSVDFYANTPQAFLEAFLRSVKSC